LLLRRRANDELRRIAVVVVTSCSGSRHSATRRVLDWQQFDDNSGQRNSNAKARNDGRWVRVFVDGHVRPVMMGRYRASGQRHLIMPKSRKDLEELCWSLDADGGGRTCGGWIDVFLSTRTEF
ncbi:MAG: hypothetical protein JNM34_11625, partial [Chthonomonadaceae bacterium]|nr:hypothetical protein [Chthonomonadaceae bacterium]